MNFFNMTVLIFLFVTGCNKKNITENDNKPANPSTVKIYAGKNRVKLSWPVSSSMINKYRVYWNQSSDSLEITPESGREDVSVIIDNLKEGVYSFAVAALDKEGHISAKTQASENVYGEEYAASLVNRAVNSITYDDVKQAVHIHWGSVGAGMVGSEVKYQNTSGENDILFVPSSENTTMLEDYSRARDSLISYRSAFRPEPSAIDTFRTSFDTVKVPKGKVLWDGDASKGYEIWKVPENIDGEGKISVVYDSTYGATWKFYKPAGSHRTESHGARGFQAEEGDIIYIGWRFKVEMPKNTSTNAVFQWKAYGDNMKQNFPEVLKHVNGNFEFLYQNPNYHSEYPWTIPTVVNDWISIVLKMKISRVEGQGYVELWYNGKKQTFDNGSTRFHARTLDAEHCDPKWGIYGGDEASITNYVADLKIATSYELAKPE